MKHSFRTTLEKLVKIGVGSYMVLHMFACSNNSENNQNDEKTYEKEQADKYYDRIKDSVLMANEYDKYQEKNYWPELSKISELNYAYTLGGTIENKVISAGENIFNKYFDEIINELQKYKLDVAPLYKYTINIDKNLFFYGVKTSEYDRDDCAVAWKDFTNDVNNIIDKSEYGPQPKSNMHNNVDNIIKNTKNALITSRKSIEQQYSDYYLLSQKNSAELGIEYLGEGYYIFGYEELNDPFINGKYLITEHSVKVYDSELSPDFFGDQDKEYKLVSLGNNKWQVVKTSASGKTEKTAVFSDKKQMTEDIYGSDEKPTKLESEFFDFTPGENMGVHVEYSEISDIKMRKKDWKEKIPANVQQQIDSLRNEIDQKEEFNSKVYEIREEIAQRARNTALNKTKQIYGNDYER